MKPLPHHARSKRRGVVLLLILGMLGLLALIGVTFATFSGQSLMAGRMFSESIIFPEHDQMMDFALAQLINDTDISTSVLRGHSIKRDMYGSDATLNGFLSQLPDGTPLALVAAQGTVNIGGVAYPVFSTNIPYGGSPQLYGLNFTRWILRINPVLRPGPPPFLAPAQTLEVLQDQNVGGFHYIAVSIPDPNPALANPADIIGGAGSFVLDGRYQRAFNGPGLGPFTIDMSGTPQPPILGGSVFGNFLFNRFLLAPPFQAAPSGNPVPAALGDPDAQPAMDEDYDAPDLENWFLGLQSADGSVTVPSFHRPGILTAADWVDPNAYARSKILRPRAVDHPAAGTATFPDLVPDPATGRITYDVDNDGDGITDSVWLDLGFPPQRDASGRLMKPLFAIMVLGLNGRIPLNTAGNLHARSPDGLPALDHASHVGYSVNEINPKYAFSAPLTGAVPSVNSLDTGQFALQRMLQGFFEPGTGRTVAGRWGDEGLLPTSGATGVFPRAGRTAPADGSDDDFDALDFIPVGTPEGGDTLDNAGAIQIPVERIRRFLTPLDVTGTGRPVHWNEWNLIAPMPAPPPFYLPLNDPYDFGHGADDRGRLSYFQYYRPHGVPLDIRTAPPFDVLPATATVPNRTNNLYHVYEGWRNPVQTPSGGSQPTQPPYATAVAPSNLYATGVVAGVVPTFRPYNVTDPTTNILSPTGFLPGNTETTGIYPGGSLNRDEADEFNPYDPSPFDAPFTFSDLEWLYRKHDVDGSSLTSRLDALGQVAPVPPPPPPYPYNLVNGYNIFTNTSVVPFPDPRNDVNTSGITRSRLFSVDSFDLIHGSWANDNPAGLFANNSRFAPADSANLDVLGVRSSFYQVDSQFNHGGRKINLNFPLPPSSDPIEPTRIKWINQAYALAKQILPPKAIDTPEELAQLSQFLINIIDFRDPDAAITRWVNPDLDFYPAEAAPPLPARVWFKGSTPVPPRTANPVDFVQYGMEFQPVALNEVLAIKSKTHTQGGNENYRSSIRMFVELVNLNTDDAAHDTGDLNLAGWQMVILPDTVTGRPDPVRGHFSTANPPTGANAPRDIGPRNAGDFVRAMGIGGNPNYHVLSNIPQVDDTAINTIDSTDNHPPGSHDGGPGAPTDVNDPPLPANLVYQLELNEQGSPNALVNPDDTTTNTGRFMWLYLLRPINPLDPSSEKVVVDSMRFVYVAGGGRITYDPMTDTHTVNANNSLRIYSTARRQPLRGNQSIPGESDRIPKFAYGYSDGGIFSTDRTPGAPAVTVRGRFTGRNMGAIATFPMTERWYQSLGKANDPSENWDLFPFHDRDFSSPAELLLVPGIAPGLFTKQFVDRENIPLNDLADPGYSPLSTNTPRTTPQLDTNPPDMRPQGQSVGGTPVFPYLPENFYYTASNDPTDGVPPLPFPNPLATIGGPTGMGWHKLLDWFDVPSSALGSIGTVADGHNRDWLRRDLKAGLVNLNLIIDEEVFFSVLDDPRLNRQPINPMAIPPTTVPGIVNQILPNGDPAPGGISPMFNRGYYEASMNLGSPPALAAPLWPPNVPRNTMKQAFADFLRIRAGCRFNLYGILPDRPFRSLSFPDIQSTILRTAAPPPNDLGGIPVARPPFPANANLGDRYLNINFDAASRIQIPQTPPRRLFQIPDYSQGSTAGPWDAELNYPALSTQLVPPNTTIIGRATLVDHTVINPRINANPDYPFPASALPAVGRFLLGGDRDEDPSPGEPPPGDDGIPNSDRRAHPMFRIEWLQKVMNQTTVRTHQYAVWITVGFFEVVRPGNPQLAGTNPDLAIDRLGPEIDRAAGRAVRYRGFFVLDRTRAGGFNPALPGDFRDLIRFRRRIE